MVTFHYIVSAKLYGCHVYTQAFWPDRTLVVVVDSLFVNVRDQLLQTFHVLAVISNLWARLLTACTISPGGNIGRLSRQRTIFCTS